MEPLAFLFNEIELQGRWPQALVHAVVSLIPKGKGSDPLHRHPISAISVVYRLWSRTRLRGALAWQEGWADPCMNGFRPRRGWVDACYSPPLVLEKAQCWPFVQDRGTGGFAFGFMKCFDRIPRTIVLTPTGRLGMPRRTLRPMKSMMVGMQRCLRDGCGVGK